MKRLMAIIGLILVLTMMLASCGQAEKEEEVIYHDRDVSVPGGGWAVPGEEEVVIPPPSVIVTEPSAPVIGEPWATERMIVRTGEITLAVEDIPAAIDNITAMADGFGGYVVSSMVWKERERLFGTISIRVPAEYFDVAMKALRGLAVDVTSEHSTSKDVTEEYVDLSAKLKNLEATEEQLLRIMEKAETVEDILDVQRELTKTRGEIEQTKARMQYLERTSATSIINIQLEQSKLEVEFQASTSRVKEGEKVRFYGDVAGGFTPYSYEWDFGDGKTSTDESPTHAYANDGTYTVSLTVTDDRGNTYTETRTEYITVLPGWSAGNIASGAWNGLVTFGHVLANIFIWLGILSPIWIIIGGLIIYGRFRRKKRLGDSPHKKVED